MLAQRIRTFRTWYAEISSLLQEKVSRNVLRRRELVGILERTRFTLLERVGNKERQLLRISSHGCEADVDFDALGDMKRRGLRVTLRLSGELGLRKLLNLPVAAKGDLDQLLRFEMDRLSPFAADEVYFAHRILRTVEERARLLVEVHIVPRTIAKRALATCTSLGLEPKCLELAEAEVDTGLNLLPPHAVIRPSISALDCGLAVFALAFAGLLIVTPLQKLRTAAAHLEGEISAESGEANASLVLREQLESLMFKINLIDSHKRSAPAITRLIAILTNLIPDDAYLVELYVGANEVRARGNARSATDVIRSLESSPALLDPKFLAPITRDPHSGREEFRIGLRRGIG